MLPAIVSTLTGLVSALISGILLANWNKARKAAEKRQTDRVERENLTLKSLDAVMSVNKELVRCVQGKEPNGELTEAFDYETDVKHEIEKYMRRKATEE